MMNIPLYYWTMKTNVGDVASMSLLNYVYKDRGDINFYHCTENAKVSCIGSVLEHKAITKDTYICGSGWHNYLGTEFKGDLNKVLGVRGKLTADFLGLNCNDICLGDPALLFPRYYNKQVEKKYDYAMICHLKDLKYFREKYKDSELHIIGVDTNNVEAFIDEVLKCKFIFSSSLHGLIFAHAYNIPAIHLERIMLESKDNFKFKDYYSVLDIDYMKLKYTDDFNFNEVYQSLNKNKLCPSKQCIATVQNNLLKMFKKLESILTEKQHLKTCVCAIAKQENNYIREWVEHYKNLGFDNIFLYDNNEVDGEHFEDVINDYIKSNFVRLINARGMGNQQIMRYNEFYHSDMANNYDWILFCDIDEFLFLKKDVSISDYLSRNIFDNFDAIAINWKYFDDNDIVMPSTYNVVNRFTRESDNQCAENRCSKRCIRTKRDLIINSSHGAIANASMKEYSQGETNKIKICNCEGKQLLRNTIYLNSSDASHEYCYLAHYRFKTIYEYISNKMSRGYPTLYKNSGKDLSLDDFFKLNNVTEEKLIVASNLMNVSFESLKNRYKDRINNDKHSHRIEYDKEKVIIDTEKNIVVTPKSIYIEPSIRQKIEKIQNSMMMGWINKKEGQEMIDKLKNNH